MEQLPSERPCEGLAGKRDVDTRLFFPVKKIALKTIFLKVDLKDLNKTQICRFLPYFFADKTDRFLA